MYRAGNFLILILFQVDLTTAKIDPYAEKYLLNAENRREGGWKRPPSFGDADDLHF